jgi:hypothetical protein
MTRETGSHTSEARPAAGPQLLPRSLTDETPLSRHLHTASSAHCEPTPSPLSPLPMPQGASPAPRRLRPQLPLRPQFRLRPGQDDALIGWLASLSPRQRSRAIRTALCQYLAEQSNRRPARRREDPDLARALDSLF